MKKYLPYHIIFVLLLLPSHQAMAQSTVYIGLTYSLGAEARADRQVYDVSTSTFDNQFSVKYPFNGNLGYLAGIGNNSFSIEYRVTESDITSPAGTASFHHNNVILTGRASAGKRRPKVGIGSGNARSGAKGDKVLSTDKNYRTTTYLIGYDFLIGADNFSETRHSFAAEYQSVIARSGTFREVDASTDISVRETIRYTQFVLAYIFRFGSTP
ncbi:MAG: hypothetical protein K0U45_05480 [Alphaproteobacteria bacterium]|nr:hypothetical protein [Alphaproteobacteria bacterium]